MNFDTLGKERAASFLSIDKTHAESSGGSRRVLRFDSFSKIISAGLRVGWVTGPSSLIDRLELHTQSTLLHPSGLSQAVVAKLFDGWGGAAGYLEHADSVAAFYMARRDAFVAAATAELGDRVSFSVPTAGMFVWMDLRGIDDANELIVRKAVDRKVLLVPGVSFTPGGGTSGWVRASYSTATEVEMKEACRRLAELLDEENGGAA
jgi:kynurenine/2-aminoadipate aminotransferase